LRYISPTCARSRRDSDSHFPVNPLSRPETHRDGGRRCRCQYFTKRAWLSSSVGSRMGLDCPCPLPSTHHHRFHHQPDAFCAPCVAALCSSAATATAASKRYQDSRKGRHAHAQRQGRWRARRQIVTHQGSPSPPDAGVLPPGDETTLNPDTSQPCKCHFCGRSVSAFVRLDFLRCRFRHPSQPFVWRSDSHDHFT
jgi:hypothetical protein